jgi:hypothetical protein
MIIPKYTLHDLTLNSHHEAVTNVKKCSTFITKCLWPFEISVVNPAYGLSCVWFILSALRCFWCPEIRTNPID